MDLCTLFDSYYLDKGIALCESLNRVEKQFQLYIFAFDELSYKILLDMDMENVTVISEEMIRDGQLERIKKERTRAEYCWTCTPVIIQYVLDHYDVKACTYIDADMYFYASPNVLMDEVEASGCNISIIGHRFPDNITKDTNIKLHGKYCVEFNTFLNNKEGREVLGWWKEKCFASCSMKLNEESFGDQKYLNEWPAMFSGIHEVLNAGAGVAPWNVADYKLTDCKGIQVELLYKKKQKCRLIFYHFQNLKFLDAGHVDIGVYNELGKFDRKLLDYLYGNYIQTLVRIRRMLSDIYELEFGGYEDRKAGNKWKYTGMKDLAAYGAVFINFFIRGKKNIVTWEE